MRYLFVFLLIGLVSCGASNTNDVELIKLSDLETACDYSDALESIHQELISISENENLIQVTQDENKKRSIFFEKGNWGTDEYKHVGEADNLIESERTESQKNAKKRIKLIRDKRFEIIKAMQKKFTKPELEECDSWSSSNELERKWFKIKRQISNYIY